MEIKVLKLKENAVMPAYQTAGSAGADLYACVDTPVEIKPGETVLIPTGLALSFPEGYGGFVFARSGLASKKGLAPANKVGVIDSDYRGELMVALFNHGSVPQVVLPQDRIAQFVILPVMHASFVPTDSLDDTSRATGGFGSTGA